MQTKADKLTYIIEDTKLQTHNYQAFIFKKDFKIGTIFDIY